MPCAVVSLLEPPGCCAINRFRHGRLTSNQARPAPDAATIAGAGSQLPNAFGPGLVFEAQASVLQPVAEVPSDLRELLSG